jgi:ERCC4-type nuclease
MSNKEKVTITIDSNEASQKPELTEVLVLHEDVSDYLIQPMEEGDIEIEGCLFERKTPNDFASSLENGRLREQVERMAGHDERAFILVEGDMADFNDLKHSQIPSKSLRGMDASIEMNNGVGVKYCSNIELLADMAVRLARKHKEDGRTITTQQSDALKKPSFMESLFLAVEKVGAKKAERLADEFHNINKVWDADQEDFEKVNGIGEELSSEIVQTVKQETNVSEKDKNTKVYNI